MVMIVSLLGWMVALVGLLGLTIPQTIIDLVQSVQGPTRFWLAIVIRTVLGIVLLGVASECRIPFFVRCIGVIAIVAAIVILLLGQKRFDTFVEWWLTRPSGVIRVSAVFAFVFGVVLAYAGG